MKEICKSMDKVTTVQRCYIEESVILENRDCNSQPMLGEVKSSGFRFVSRGRTEKYKDLHAVLENENEVD